MFKLITHYVKTTEESKRQTTRVFQIKLLEKLKSNFKISIIAKRFLKLSFHSILINLFHFLNDTTQESILLTLHNGSINKFLIK